MIPPPMKSKKLLVLAVWISLVFSGYARAQQDAALSAYQGRASKIIQGNLASLKSWAVANATVSDNAQPNKLSIWTAAAGFANGTSSPDTLAAARKLAAGIMEYRVTHLFQGGNDGWPAWATADTRVRYSHLITADPNRYAPAGYPKNAKSIDGKYSLDDLFHIVLTQSFYAPIDSTSNHCLMNATARFLAEVAYPGEVLKPYNNNTKDPTGASYIITRAKELATSGPAEYGSPNYGADNWGEFLSLSQLPPSLSIYPEVKSASTLAYSVALADMGAFWMNGNLAMPTGRGYPSTGAWGVAAGDVLTWVYFGGDFGNSNINDTVSDTGEKTLGVLGAEGLLSGYVPPLGILHLSDPVPRVSKANFGLNHQYSYMTGNYGHSCESYKDGAHGGWQTHWDSRVVWTKPYDQNYQATAWIANVGVNATKTNNIITPTKDSSGNYLSVDPVTLRPYALYGSGTYGESTYEDFTQNLDTVLHVYNIPPSQIAGAPGGCMPIRGALVYLPIPNVSVMQGTKKISVTPTNNYISPQISPDGKRLYVAYNSVFISFNSSAPIANPLPTDIIASRGSQFFRVYGGTDANNPVDANKYIQFAVAVQTASPDDYPGTTLAEKFANFKAVMGKLSAPAMVKVDQLHPVWQFSDGIATLSSTYQGDRYHGGNDGKGEDWIGGPNNENPTLIDYYKWPQLHEELLRPDTLLLDQAQGGNITVSFPGTQTVLFDISKSQVTTNAAVSITTTSNIVK